MAGWKKACAAPKRKAIASSTARVAWPVRRAAGQDRHADDLAGVAEAQDPAPIVAVDGLAGGQGEQEQGHEGDEADQADVEGAEARRSRVWRDRA